jgi:hypothetical protein
MSRVSLTLLLVALLGPSMPAGPRKERPREPYEDAVDRGLAYLARTQGPGGGWGSEFAGNRPESGHPALTALAVLAFLSAGHVPGEGKYGPNVERGVQFVMRSQQRNGLFARPDSGFTEVYSHGVCTLMLAEVAGMSDERSATELRERVERAVKVILKAQRSDGRDAGGWRYQLVGTDADLSVTGWQLVALRAARDLGCDVPRDRISLAVEYVRRCFDTRSGGFSYTIGGNVTPACTGTGTLVLELAGKEFHKSQDVLRAGGHLRRNPPDLAKPHFFYGVYYTAQAMFQLGDNYWGQYRNRLHEMLLKESPQRTNGAWYGKGFDDQEYGPAYATAMAILALTVEYQYLPIYQRDEGKWEGRGGSRE